MLASNGPAEALAEPLRAIVRSIDPGMPVLGLRTMEDYYDSRVIGVSRLIVGTVGGMGTDRRRAGDGRTVRTHGLRGEPAHA